MSKRKCCQSGDVPVSHSRKDCNDVRLVYLLGFSSDEELELKRKAQKEVNYTDHLTAGVTHVVLNSKCIGSRISTTKLIYAAVSGSWIVRPSWLLNESTEDVCTVEPNQINIQFTKSNTDSLKEALKLGRFYSQSRLKIFEGPDFRRILLLSNSKAPADLECDVRSIFDVSGGTFVVSSIINKLLLKGRNDNLVTVVITLSDEFDSFDQVLLKQLLGDRVPVIFYEKLINFVKEMRAPTRKELMALSHQMRSDDITSQKGISLLENLESAPSSSLSKSSTKTAETSNSERLITDTFLPRANMAIFLCEPTIYNTWIEYVSVTDKYKHIANNIEVYKNKVFCQSIESMNNFSHIINEFELNTKAEEVSGLICYSAANYLVNSNEPDFLPSPEAISFLLHKIIMGKSGGFFDTYQTAFTFIKRLLFKYPPRNFESRLFWVQALCLQRKTDKKGVKLQYDVNEILETARIMIEKTLQKDPIDANFLDIMLHILELDLYFFEKECDVAGPINNVKRAPTKNAVLLLTHPIAYLLVDKFGYTYGRSLDKWSKDVLVAIGEQVAALEYSTKHISLITRLHTVLLEMSFQQGDAGQDVRTELTNIIRRMIQHGVKKETMREFYPIEWINCIITHIK